MLLSADIDRDALCRALVDGMADAVLVLDPGPGRFILANEAASLLLGYSVEQLCTMQPAELSNAWDVARLSEIGQGVAEHGVWRGHRLLMHQQGQLLGLDVVVSKLALGDEALYLAVLRETAQPQADGGPPSNDPEPYSLTFERNPLPMWIFDRETLGFLAVNQAAIRQYGFSREEFSRMTLRDLRDPDDLQNLARQISLPRRGPVTGLFVRHRREDGTLVEAEISSDELFFNGRSARLVVAKDVTDQRRTEAAIRALNTDLDQRVAERTRHLRESEERFRALVASVPGLIYRCTPGTWELQFVGGLVESITGYPSSDFTSGARTFANLVDPSDTARVRQEVAEQLAASGAFATEYRLTHAGGQTRWVYERGRAVMEANGSAAWLDGVVVDVTDRRLAEDERARLVGAISQERAMLASILAGIDDALLVVGTDGVVWFANDRLGELLGVASDDLVGRPLQEIIEERRIVAPAEAATWDTLDGVFAERELDGFDLHLQGPPPREYRGSVFTVPAVGAAGAGVGVLLHDVTLMGEVSRLKDEIIGIVSHELRAPLASVLGFAELVLRRDPPPEKRREYLTVMLDEGRRLTNLINAFLDLEYFRHGLHGVSLVPIDPRDLLIGAVTAADSDPDHPIILDVPMWLPPVLADADRMRQVLWNLLSNARKYSPDPSEIRVAARSVDGQLAITVTDRGIGIPRDALPRVFERFFRVAASESVNVAGAGLGLSIVKQLVEAHGGSVWAQSAGLHQGATFGFSLRFAEPPSLGMASA